MMAFSFPLVYTAVILLISLQGYFYVHKYTSVSCSLSEKISTSNDNDIVSSYFTALDGIYVKYGGQLTSIPDMFEWPLAIDRFNFIAFFQSNWVVFKQKSDDKNAVQPVYENSNFRELGFIDHPPSDVISWTTLQASNANIGGVQEVTCSGSLQYARHSDEYYENDSDHNNLQMLQNRPVTTLILIVILAVFYSIQSGRVEQDKVVYSYHTVVNNREYLRIFWASISHFDYLHILFNAMGFYSFNILEYKFGSVAYLAYTLYLIPLTMLLVILMQYLMIHKFNMIDQINQTSVGFSCVLFAYIVAISILDDQYCPIFLFPNFCFSTHHFGPKHLNLSFNLGPFILLIVTKLIIPRSSFIGHFAGLLIGYPLAWGAFEYINPLCFISLITILVAVRENFIFSVDKLRLVLSDVFNTAGNGLAASDAEVQGRNREESIFNLATFKSLSVIYVVLCIFNVLICIYYSSWTQVLIRLVVAYIIATTFISLRHSILFETPAGPTVSGDMNNSASSDLLSSLLLTNFALLSFVTFYDVYNLVGLFTAKPVLLIYYGYHSNFILFVFYFSQAFVVFCQWTILVKTIQVMVLISKSNYLTAASVNFDTIVIMRQWVELLRISREDISSDLLLIKSVIFGFFEYAFSILKQILKRIGELFSLKCCQHESGNSNTSSTTNNNTDTTNDDNENENTSCFSRFFNILSGDRGSGSASNGSNQYSIVRANDDSSDNPPLSNSSINI